MKKQQTETNKNASLVEKEALKRLVMEDLEEMEEIDYRDFPFPFVESGQCFDDYYH